MFCGAQGCQKNALNDSFKMYYLRLKMIISFLEFDIFWESLFTFMLMQIALWHKLDSSSKKEFTKIMQKEWKVNKLCWLFPENTCTNNISSTEIDTWFYFFLGFWPKTSKFTRKEGRYRHKQYILEKLSSERIFWASWIFSKRITLWMQGHEITIFKRR